MTTGITKTKITAVCAAIILSGCSFKEDRTDVDVPIVDAFPSKSQPSQQYGAKKGNSSSKAYIYTVQYGDTLGTIAQEYLGSSSRYTELMALNKLDRDDAIFVGQKLKLPLAGLQKLPGSNSKNNQSSEDSEQTVVQSSPKDEVYPELDELIQKQQYNRAIEWVLGQEDLSGSDLLQQKLLLATQQQVKLYQRQQNIIDAETLLSGLIDNDDISSNNRNVLEKELSRLRAEQQLVVAKRYADDEEFDKAYTILLNAWQKVGQPLENNILFTGSRNTVSEHYHQKALRHYRNQELDQALNYWEKILAFNPNDDLALVYRDRVKALQNKLENL